MSTTLFQYNQSKQTYLTTARHLLAALHALRAGQHVQVPTGMWDDPFWTLKQFHCWFRKALDAKINREDTRFRDWRKLQQDYQVSLGRDAQIIHDAGRRIRRSGCNLLSTPELKRRYPEIHNPEGRSCKDACT